MDKILLVKTSALGDIVHTYPVVEYLRNKFPEAQIDWAVEAPFADLVRSHPDVNRTLCVETKAWRKRFLSRETWRSIRQFREELQKERYDAAWDLQGNIKSGLILSQARSPCKAGFGRGSVAEWPNLLFTNCKILPQTSGNIRHMYLSLAASFFQDPLPEIKGKVQLTLSAEQQEILNRVLQRCVALPGKKIMVCPGSAWRNKQLPPETFKSFLQLVKNEISCSFLLLWGTEEERQVAEEICATFPDAALVLERMGLPAVQNLMEACDVVIAMDSLPLHLAATTGTPTFSIFGASSAAKYQPLGEQHRALQGSCPYGRTFEKRCPVLRTCPTGACIRSLHAKALFSAFQELLLQPCKAFDAALFKHETKQPNR